MLVVAYLRVSTDGQTVENQRREIEAAGVEPKMVFRDVVGGRTRAEERPGLAGAIQALRAAEGPKRLVVTKLDRLGRDTADVLGTIKGLEAIGAEVVVLQLGKLDLASAAGKLMLTMLAAVAEMERDLLVERTHAGLEQARAQGKKGGRPVALSGEKAAEAKVMRNAGASLVEIARGLGVSRTAVRRVVQAGTEGDR